MTCTCWCNQCRKTCARLQFYTSLTALVMQVHSVHSVHCLPWCNRDFVWQNSMNPRTIQCKPLQDVVKLCQKIIFHFHFMNLFAISADFFSQAPIFLLTEAASVWVETWNGNPRPLQAYVFVAYICDMSCAYYVMCNYHCEASIFLWTFCGASKLSSCSACRNHYPQKILKSEIHFCEKPTTHRPFVSSRMRSNEKPWTYYPQSPIHDLRSESKFVSNRFPIKSAISLWQSTWCFDRF